VVGVLSREQLADDLLAVRPRRADRLPDQAAAAHALDRVHPVAAGYRARARAIASAVRSCS